MTQKKYKVNITTPNSWDFDSFIKFHSPGQSRTWEEFQFYHNRQDGIFDFWIVLNNLPSTTRLSVTQGNVFLVTTEEVDVIKGYSSRFLEQFDHIITSRSDIKLKNTIKSHYFTIWHIKKSYDELMHTVNNGINKTKDLSAIISSRLMYGQQVKRYALINKLKGHFKSKLDWYSREENPIADKWDGLAPYKYSIAIENSAHPGYFTEKIVDVLLSGAIPFYWGAPNISEYFPEDLVVSIPMDDYESCIGIIENNIHGNHYLDKLDLINESKFKILNEYQFLPWLSKILRVNHSNQTKQAKIVLKNYDGHNIFERIFVRLKALINQNG